MFKLIQVKIMLFIIVIFGLTLFSFSSSADSGFKVGQMFKQNIFCFSEDSIYKFVEADVESETKAMMLFKFLSYYNLCGRLTNPVPVVVKSILMDYIDLAGNKIQVVIVDFPEDFKHLKSEKKLYTIVYQKFSKYAPYAKEHI